MANYTAADVKRLRELTGAGFMDCKKALEETDSDFEKAVEVLRIKGAKDVGKRAERTAAEGMVAASGHALIELNSETDFVAKNSEFQELGAKIAEAAAGLSGQVDVAAVLAAPLDGGTVEQAIAALSAKIGEKLVLNRVARFEGDTAVYLHKRSADLPPSIGVLVAYTGTGDEAQETARGAAMQVSALKARYVSRDAVPADVVESEKRIAEATAREEGKPEGALPKIVEGRVNGFYKESVLVEQASVRDSKQTVGKQLADAGVAVTDFVRFEVGTA
ncbi:elongation factor Ts [Nakamurella flavida]|uniref:Elongation factor Ts n=1 Tax=Nakamurella flavida TaxID=363630 RepID=A0A939C5G2_9ACTN|nr:translation elongation factor Ts [Nakamurella flavida]MBM9476162.1 elongation factor Ts [Nakamurella flavida]MDP9777093.1 elongation factor Ts [Nakamurella flavida]